MRILFAGIIARYPFGGVTWCSLMYLLGLRALGHEVFYIEDTGECVYDPVLNTRATDPGLRHHLHPQRARAVRPRRPLVVRELRRQLSRAHRRRGPRATRPDADLFINLSGGSWFWRDEYARIPHKVFIDSDPAFTQLAIAKAEPWYVEFFQRFDHLFTFGANIGTPASPIPTGAFTWHKTWQPITIDDWRTDARAARPLHDGDDLADRKLHRRRRQQGSGVREVHRPAVADAAALRARDQRSAAAAARSHGWDTVDAMQVSRTPAEYRDFIQRLEGRVRRRQAHLRRQPLAAGSATAPSAISRPAARRWSRTPAGRAHLPSGDGLLAFSNIDEAIAGIERINARLRSPRAPRRRDRPRALRRAASCCRHAAGARRLHMRIAHIAPVATTIPPPKSGSVETMTSLLTEGLVARGHDVTLFATGRLEDQGKLHAHLPARLLARRAHVAVGAVRDAEPGRRGRARGRVRHHPLRGGVLPDVARVHAALADADRPDAAPFAERRGGAALVALPGGAVRRDLATSRRVC